MLSASSFSSGVASCSDKDEKSASSYNNRQATIQSPKHEGVFFLKVMDFSFHSSMRAWFSQAIIWQELTEFALGWWLFGHLFSPLPFLSFYSLSLRDGDLLQTEILLIMADKPKTTNKPTTLSQKHVLNPSSELSP